MYARGSTVYRVCDGEIMWAADASDVLCAFAHRCARRYAHDIADPDDVSPYLMTGVTDVRVTTERDAWDVARDTAREVSLTTQRDDEIALQRSDLESAILGLRG